MTYHHFSYANLYFYFLTEDEINITMDIQEEKHEDDVIKTEEKAENEIIDEELSGLKDEENKDSIEIAKSIDEPLSGDSPDTEEDHSVKKIDYVAADAPWIERIREVFVAFWPLGFVAFGGPPVRNLPKWNEIRCETICSLNNWFYFFSF